MRRVISATPLFNTKALASRLAGDCVIVTDPSQAMCGRYGFQTLYEMPAPLQKRARLELIRQHAAALRNANDVVFDHSVFMWLADWMRWLWSETPAKEWNVVLAEAQEVAALSDQIYHVITGTAAAYDGYRWLDEENARQVEKLCRWLYKEFQCENRVVEGAA